ncbi:hypothetical protein HOD05_02165 [Candidatus Woesearchaeota archaeon]|jgi:hypothetical protein|nr:hypothetical protein [Candidatus Woesearchaeota archaeon]MBT4151240.1 hypothetical protein [Candidatus Woesearchaeota archaeon]MBT4247287.1 hypothetical protein [Candidatus Woesearchaeota archaeon]MBT4434000.1 hypothetical protein [Candidatus Woesearchaeota archaeon]MBT7332397.1 hypothetical protein [Candidatus Woesearchaeota archaeon]
MAKRKTTRKRTVKRKATKKRSSSKRKATTTKRTVKRESGPAYMVQLSDPKSIRKDILESLREVIIFMQAHEKFMRIQEEKVTLFTKLKNDVKELNLLIEHKLKKHLPKGKLKAVSRYVEKRKKQQDMEKVEVVSAREMANSPRMPEVPVNVVSTLPNGSIPQPLPNPLPPAAPLPPPQPGQTPAPSPVPMAPPMPKPVAPKSDLDDLENQLKDIEDQLRGIQ